MLKDRRRGNRASGEQCRPRVRTHHAIDLETLAPLKRFDGGERPAAEVAVDRAVVYTEGAEGGLNPGDFGPVRMQLVARHRGLIILGPGARGSLRHWATALGV